MIIFDKHRDIYGENESGEKYIRMTEPKATGGTAKYISFETKETKVKTDGKIRIHRGTKA